MPSEAGQPFLPESLALAAGALAGMISWLDGPSEGLLRIGREQGFLPPFFQKTDRHGFEIRIIAAQGTAITLIALLYALIPTGSANPIGRYRTNGRSRGPRNPAPDSRPRALTMRIRQLPYMQ